MARGVPILLPEWANSCLSKEMWTEPTSDLFHPKYVPQPGGIASLFEGVVAYVGVCTDPSLDVFNELLLSTGATVTKDISKATCMFFGVCIMSWIYRRVWLTTFII